MVDTTELFSTDKPYATAADHEGISEATTIEAAGVDEFNGESFAWVKLGNVEKPIRLNKTNGRALVGPFGGDSDGWVGKPVFVTTASGSFDNGKAWVGWRISPINTPNNQTKKPGGKPAFDDDIPF